MPTGWRDVEMQIAVAHVAEGHDAGHPAMKPCTAAVASAINCGSLRHRHRDIVLDRTALESSATPASVRGSPTIRWRWLSDCATVASLARPRATASSRMRRKQPSGTSASSASTYQGEPCASGLRTPMCLTVKSMPIARKELEGHGAVAAHLARERQKIDRRLRSGHRHEGSLVRFRLGKKLQHRGGDDAESAFRADEQVLEIVAGIVLAQPPQSVPDPPVGQHHFEPEAEIAGIAIGQHIEPAGIGRQIAADAAGAFRGEAQGKQPVRRIGCLLHRFERRARPRPSWCCWPHRPRRCGSCGRATAAPRVLIRAGSARRPVRYCPIAARSPFSVSLAIARMRETSSVEPGRSTMGDLPCHRSRHSCM